MHLKHSELLYILKERYLRSIKGHFIRAALPTLHKYLFNIIYPVINVKPGMALHLGKSSVNTENTNLCPQGV
jgi:hypothetical protein